MTLWITDSGANTSEIRRGVHAAERYFENWGWSPSLIWRMREADDERAADLWQAAEAAAFRVAFKDWKAWPEHASLVWED
jgi:hypothetical protein